MTKTKFLLLILTTTISTLIAQSQNPLTKILSSEEPKIKNVISNVDSFEVQIIYTVIDRDKDNYPSFTDYEFGVKPKNYFYPASTVKLPACVLALEKLNELNIDGLDRYSLLRIDSAYAGQTKVRADSSSADTKPSIAHYIKKILLVSDNDAFNRLYEFIGQRQLNEGLFRRGLSDFKLVHRLAIRYSSVANANTNPFLFYDGVNILYEQPAQFNNSQFLIELSNTKRGKGYINADGNLIPEPMEFASKNYMSLPTLHETLKRIIFPYTFQRSQRFNLTMDDYSFLYKYMSMLPLESDYPKYDSTHYDGYVKFFMYGDTKDSIPADIRIYNKVGLAYGFLTDFAYIVDFENKIEFLLTATLHVNKNQIYNDGVYEYDEIGIPFLAELGRQLYSYELKRDRKYDPDLGRFKVSYE